MNIKMCQKLVQECGTITGFNYAFTKLLLKKAEAIVDRLMSEKEVTEYIEEVEEDLVPILKYLSDQVPECIGSYKMSKTDDIMTALKRVEKFLSIFED